MNKTTLNIGSVTYATKAKKILKHLNIDSEIVKLSPQSNNGGCSYGIQFKSDKIYEVVMQLKENGISYNLYSNKEKNDNHKRKD